MLLLCRRNTRQEGGPRPVESLVAAVDAILLRHCFPSSSRLRSIEDRIQSPEIPIAHDSLTHQLHMSDKDLQSIRGNGDRSAEEVRRLELEEARQRDLKKKAQDEAAKASLDAKRKSVADFDPEWVRKSLIVKGTVSRVQLKPDPPDAAGQRTVWVILYFKESPDGAFVMCIFNGTRPGWRNSDIGRVGSENYSGLIGKTVETSALVSHPRCAPNSVGMEINIPTQIQVF
jgi:hypothetical protein